MYVCMDAYTLKQKYMLELHVHIISNQTAIGIEAQCKLLE